MEAGCDEGTVITNWLTVDKETVDVVVTWFDIQEDKAADPVTDEVTAGVTVAVDPPAPSSLLHA